MITNNLKIKSVILCPCCKKGKIIAFKSASGTSSVVCAVCKNFIIVDYDGMTAYKGEAQKGAYRMMGHK